MSSGISFSPEEYFLEDKTLIRHLFSTYGNAEQMKAPHSELTHLSRYLQIALLSKMMDPLSSSTGTLPNGCNFM